MWPITICNGNWTSSILPSDQETDRGTRPLETGWGDMTPCDTRDLHAQQDARASCERIEQVASDDQPARCFNRVMHGGINWDGRTRWDWRNAIDLCEGTTNADATVLSAVRLCGAPVGGGGDCGCDEKAGGEVAADRFLSCYGPALGPESEAQTASGTAVGSFHLTVIGRLPCHSANWTSPQ